MTLDQLIATLSDLRRTHGGETPVICGSAFIDTTWIPEPDFIDGQVWL